MSLKHQMVVAGTDSEILSKEVEIGKPETDLYFLGPIMIHFTVKVLLICGNLLSWFEQTLQVHRFFLNSVDFSFLKIIDMMDLTN